MSLATFYRSTTNALRADNIAKASANQRALPVMVCAGICAATLMPSLAIAGPWDGVAANVLGIFTGGLTRTLAIIAIIACGIAAIAGKLSWDWAIKIVVGIMLIFGGAAIVDYIIAATN